jgi:hypothetical protein
MITGLAGTARVPFSRATKASCTETPRVIVVTDQFPVLSQTFILEQMTGLIDRGVGVEHWSLQRMDEQVVHDNVQKYGCWNPPASSRCLLRPYGPIRNAGPNIFCGPTT